MNSRNTKQKEIILKILQSHKTHPTIQEIYDIAKVQDSNIGQATIYRNIKRLVEEGEILKIQNSINDTYHYDINATPHMHLLCKNCQKIVDICSNDYTLFLESIEKKHFIKINKTNISFEGLCGDCMKKTP